MANLKLRKLVNFRILAGLFISAALVPAICAQSSRQLQVEVGPNQQVRILARDASYGEILRALQKKLGWEVEIPALADELKPSYVRVETTQPQLALTKLLEGSGLGYAFTSGVGESRHIKVFIIPLSPRDASAAQDKASSTPVSDNAVAEVSLPPATQEQSATSTQPNATTAETAPERRPPAPSTLPLSEAANAIGVPPGVSPADVGRMMTFSTSDAAKIMGVPPGLSPGDVGQTTTLSSSDAARIIGGPAGTSLDSVGKTKTLPLPTGPGQRP